MLRWYDLVKSPNPTIPIIFFCRQLTSGAPSITCSNFDCVHRDICTKTQSSLRLLVPLRTLSNWRSINVHIHSFIHTQHSHHLMAISKSTCISWLPPLTLSLQSSSSWTSSQERRNPSKFIPTWIFGCTKPSYINHYLNGLQPDAVWAECPYSTNGVKALKVKLEKMTSYTEMNNNWYLIGWMQLPAHKAAWQTLHAASSCSHCKHTWRWQRIICWHKPRQRQSKVHQFILLVNYFHDSDDDDDNDYNYYTTVLLWIHSIFHWLIF